MTSVQVLPEVCSDERPHILGEDCWCEPRVVHRGAEQPLVKAVRQAVAVLGRPHKHDWRPDLVTCGAEQDALGILLVALEERP